MSSTLNLRRHHHKESKTTMGDSGKGMSKGTSAVQAMERRRLTACIAILMLLLLAAGVACALVWLLVVPSTENGDTDSSSSGGGIQDGTISDNGPTTYRPPSTTTGDFQEIGPTTVFSGFPEIPEECNNDVNRYVPTRNYCSWDRSLQDCYELLMQHVHQTTSWALLGDYGMSQIAYYISLKWPYQSLDISSRRNACQNLEYYNLPAQLPWKAPNHTRGEGPIGYGKEHPFCTDGQKSWNVLLSSPREVRKYVEYLVVEYARDVTLPTTVAPTTQETVVYYLEDRRPDVCVTGAGIHDSLIVDPKTGNPIKIDVYLQNVDMYISRLRQVCEHVIWIGLPAVTIGPENSLHDNCKLKEWNSYVFGLLDLRGYDNVYMFDIWDRSIGTEHNENVYLSRKFYSSLARLFVSIMAGPDLTR